LAADGGKIALWELYKAGYEVANWIHDEALVELPNDEFLQAHCRDVDRIMIESMRQVVLHVAIRVGGALMDRWIKGAEPVFDAAGAKIVFTEGCMEADKARDVPKRKTPEVFPTAACVKGLSREEIAACAPEGFRALLSAKGGLWGFQPMAEIVPQMEQQLEELP
jgi:hypothetical protein